MKRITTLRTQKGWSKAELGRRARVHPARVGQTESGRVVPYPVECARLAQALDWTGKPDAILEEVEDRGPAT